MQFTPQQLADELRGSVRGRLIVDTFARGLYATDASPFHLLPAVVVAPRDEDDLRGIVAFAQERGVPIVPRGAGTGLSGESLGNGIVVDLSPHFRRFLALDDSTVTLEPGLTLDEVNAVLAQHGRRIAPLPASSATCTIGGMIATNASGSNAYLHGYTRNHVADLRFLGDEGQPCETASDPRKLTVAALLRENRELIDTHRTRVCFNRCGYLLHDLLEANDSQANLAKLLTGSEGTLGIITQATLRTIPLAGGTCQFTIGFPTLEAALRIAPELRGVPGIAACDLLDQRMLSLVKVPLVPSSAGAVLIGTIEATTEREAFLHGQQIVEQIRASHPCLVLHEPTCHPADRQQIESLRESAVTGLYAIGRGRRPVAFVEDIAVPGERVLEFIARVQEMLRTEEVNASFLVHLLTGQVHTRPFLDLRKSSDQDKMWPLADAMYALALELGGTISSQHGVGLARTPWVEKQYGPLVPVFREIKRLFDPKGILNPGKILGPDPSRPAWPMIPPEPSTPEVRQPLLVWNETSPTEEAAKCNGCGDCRPRHGPTRMCPIYRATGDEAATPRAKANIIKRLDPPDQIATDEVAAIAQLCVNCKMCREECRAKVDVPKLMLEAKAAHYEEYGFNRHEWLIARTESLARLAGQITWTTNLLLGSRWSRWLLEKLFGLSRRRQLPRFAHRAFLRRAWWAGWTQRVSPDRPGRKVAYFVDVYANYVDPSIGEAAVAVLKHHGFEVHVPRRQRGSGMTALSYGDADTAREQARYNVRQLAELVRDGYTIVCTEPAATLALTHDYLNLLDDADARLVATHTHELMNFLGELHARGELKPTTRPLPLGIGHHVPCHVKALGYPPAGPRLLSLIAGTTVDTIDSSCSGMAGTWGLSVRNAQASRQAGAEMVAALDRPRILYGSTECSACRLQMQDTTGKRTLHPIQYLALAYGLLPELEDKLTRPLHPGLID